MSVSGLLRARQRELAERVEAISVIHEVGESSPAVERELSLAVAEAEWLCCLAEEWCAHLEGLGG